MAPSLKIVVVFLVTVQLAQQQAAISNKYYDTKDLNSPLNNEFSFHSRFNVLSSLKKKQSPRHEQQLKSKGEQIHLDVDRDSVSSFRSKRQLDQDAETDAEIISNDSKMISYGKSMPMTTSEDEIDKLHHEKLGSDSWNEDVDTSHKNSLGELEDEPKEAEEEEKEDDDEEQDAQSDIQENKQTFQDIKIADQDNVSASETTHNNSTNIHVVPTLIYAHPGSIESDSQHGNSKSSELQDSAHIEDGDQDKGDKVISDKDEDHSTQNTQESSVAEEKLETNDDHKKIGSLENVEKGKDTESETNENEMEKEAVNTAHEEAHSSGATKQNDADVEPQDNVSEQVLSKELNIDDNEGELSENFDNDDAEVFMHIPEVDSGSKTSSGQLKLLEGDSAVSSEEGSGDMENDPTGSHETHHMHNNVATNSTDNYHSVEMSPTTDSINFNIDSDNTKEGSDYIEEDEEDIEAPISDPTEIGSKIVDPAKTVLPSEGDEDDENHQELPIPDHTEEPKIDNDAVTYDPKAIINPFNIDNASEITRNIGKAIGIIDSSEETTEGEESEGSGNFVLIHDTELEKNSLENGAMFEIDPRMLPEDTQPDSTTIRHGSSNVNEVTEEPFIVRHHDDLFNEARKPANEDDGAGETTKTPEVVAGVEITSDGSIDSPIEEVSEATPTLSTLVPPEHGERIFDTVSISENGSALAGINEMGIQKSEKTESSESTDETSSSSTGSFIVLGAIMATIVALLGYSVIKSHRQKQLNSRRPPEDDTGTELKEIDTLLTDRNGHGPAIKLNVESDRLLSPGGENDKHELKPDGRNPIFQNGVDRENGKVSQPTNGLQIEDPNGLSEVKVQPLNADASNPQVANGFGSKSSPRNSDRSNQLDEPKSPSANNRGPRNYITKPETAKIKMFIDHDSIPKTPIVIVKRGSANV